MIEGAVADRVQCLKMALKTGHSDLHHQGIRITCVRWLELGKHIGNNAASQLHFRSPEVSSWLSINPVTEVFTKRYACTHFSGLACWL